MDSGWSLKHLHRLIVTSATYRQSSRVTPELLRPRPVQPPAGPRAAVPRRGRDRPRHRPGGQRPARTQDRRPERLPAGAGVPVPAAGQLRAQGLERGDRAGPLSPGPLHVPLPLGALPDAPDLRRAQRRLLLRPPRALEHAAAGADDAQRADLPRMRPGPGPADA